MISVTEAKKIISDNTSTSVPVQLLLSETLGMVLAADIIAGMDIPAFPQSSMDGYAFSFSGWEINKTLEIKGVMPAGSDEMISFHPGQAVRIFTGAAVPAGADTVVMQEKVTTENGLLYIEDEKLVAGSNVRPRGSEINTGEMALAKGSVLTPAAIGFLAGIGITHVTVYPKPSVAIIVTGKELQQPGKPIGYGQVYESNSASLTAALQQLNITNVQLFWADDDLEILTQVIKTALQKMDIVLLTGGVSVGDYDFVLEAAEQCGITTLFHKIKQRPGKPLFVGRHEEQLVFGLPGNPSSVLTCFYEYVLPALQKFCYHKKGLSILQAPLAKPLQKAAGLTHFLKGYYDGEKVTSLNAQESYRLSSFAKANCLVQLNEDVTHCGEGDLVEIHLLPGQ